MDMMEYCVFERNKNMTREEMIDKCIEFISRLHPEGSNLSTDGVDAMNCIAWLKSIKELPSELKGAAEEYAYQGIPDRMKSVFKPLADEIAKYFIAGAEWDRAKMMEGAVEGEVLGYDDGTGKFITVLEDLPDDSPYKVHDKVKLIVIPEE